MKLSDEVLAALSSVEIAYPGIVRMPKMDRKIYLQVDKTLQALGGKWDRKRSAHVFELEVDDGRGLIQARIDAAIAAGDVTTNADLAFFQTPRSIAGMLCSMAEIEEHHSVLEPSAGIGAIYEAIKIYNPTFVGLVERDADRRHKLKLTQRDRDEVCEHDDFMEFDESEPYDRVVMNPPFKKVGLGDHLDHVQHAFGMLAPGGVLVSVLPAGVVFRTDKRHIRFRQWADKQHGEITPLPDNAFRGSGTDVRTVVLRARKR